MRGRKPLPSNVVRLRGNPGKRRLNDAEPRPAAKVPPCPACLGDEARKEWQRLSKELAELGLLTGLDRNLLAAYCQAHALWVEAVVLDRALRHHGQVAERLPDAEPLRRGRQQAGRHHGADRRRVRHDALLPHPHPGRRQAARGSLRGVSADRG